MEIHMFEMIDKLASFIFSKKFENAMFQVLVIWFGLCVLIEIYLKYKGN